MPTRRQFVGLAASGLLGAAAVRSSAAGVTLTSARGGLLKPRRLHAGDLVGVINPTQQPSTPMDAEAVERALRGLGLRTLRAAHIGKGRVGEEDRAADVNEMFLDDAVRAVLPVSGGYGAARLLEYLDYEAIRSAPKVVMGYSDVAALLVGMHTRTGLVTFHGPMGASAWGPFTVSHMRRVLFDAEAVTIATRAAGAAQPAFRTLTPGVARGRLLGGNLTVLSSIVGSPFIPDGEDVILFVEEVREPFSEVDRMMTQLDLAGILPRVRGFVFGQCTRCSAPRMDGAMTLDAVLEDHIRPLGVPAWRGAPIGHTDRQLTLPIGLPVEIDAAQGTIRLLEPAVL